MAAELDRIDLKILKVLQEDATKSASEIADVVGLSQSPCWRRIQRLKEMGYISEFSRSDGVSCDSGSVRFSTSGGRQGYSRIRRILLRTTFEIARCS